MTTLIILVLVIYILKQKGAFMKFKSLKLKKITKNSIKKNAERIISIHKNELNLHKFHDGVTNVVEEDNRFRLIVYCTFFSNDEEHIKGYVDGMIHKMCPEGHRHDIVDREVRTYTGITTVYYETNIMK